MAGETDVNKKRGISGEKGKDIAVEERIHGRASLRSRSLLKNKGREGNIRQGRAGGEPRGGVASERVRVRQTARREAGAKDKT